MSPVTVLAGFKELSCEELLFVAPAVLDSSIDGGTNVNRGASGISSIRDVLDDVAPFAVLASLQELPCEELLLVTTAVLDGAVDRGADVDCRAGSISGVGNVLKNMAPVAVLAGLEFLTPAVLRSASFILIRLTMQTLRIRITHP